MYVGTVEMAADVIFHRAKSKTSRCCGYKTAETMTLYPFLLTKLLTYDLTSQKVVFTFELMKFLLKT
jgi:hypothetical protein